LPEFVGRIAPVDAIPEIANLLLEAVPFEDGRHAEPLAVIYRKNRKLTPPIIQST
jgi:hypothetical protein